MSSFVYHLLVVATVFFGALANVKAGDESVKLPPRAVARLGSSAFGQGQAVLALAVSADGKLVAAADTGTVVEVQGKSEWNYDNIAIRLWEVPAGRSLRRIPVPEGPVLAIDLSPDGKLLAAGAGKKVYVWDLETGKETQRIRLDDYPIQVRFTADSNQLLFNLYNREVLRWDLEKRTETVLWTRKAIDNSLYVRNLDLSSDGTRLSLVLGKMPQVNFDPNTPPPPPDGPHQVQALELPGGKLLYQADGKDITSYSALSPDMKAIAYGSERIGIYDLAAKKKRRELAAVPNPPGRQIAIPVPGMEIPAPKKWQTASMFAFSPNGKCLVAVYRANSFLFPPGGNSYADMVIWNVETGVKIAEFVHPVNSNAIHASYVMAFSGDSRWLALPGADVVRLFDLATGRELAPWNGHRLNVTDIRYSPDGRTLLTRAESDLCSWDPRTGRQLKREDIRPLRKKDLLASSIEKGVIVTQRDGDFLLEDLATGKLITKIAGKEKKFDGGSFSYRGDIVCLDTFSESNQLHAIFYSVPGGKELCQLKLDNPHQFGFSPVRDAFTWTDREGYYHEADGRTGKILRKIDLGVKPPDPNGGDFYFELGSVYSWDGKYLLKQTYKNDEQFVKIWDLDQGVAVRDLRFSRRDFVRSFDFTFDSRLLVYAQMSKNGLRVMELASARERRGLIMAGEQNPNRLATSPTDYTLAAGIPGNTVMLWDLARPTRKLAKPSLTEKELQQLLAELAENDAIRAEDAIETLAQAPASATPFLKARLKPIAAMDAALVDRLIAEVGSDDFAVRKKAMAALERQLELAEPAIRAALGKSSLETRRRFEGILKKLPTPIDAPTLQALRALEVLEKIGAGDARIVIEHLATGAPSAIVTREASAALRRMKVSDKNQRSGS